MVIDSRHEQSYRFSLFLCKGEKSYYFIFYNIFKILIIIFKHTSQNALKGLTLCLDLFKCSKVVPYVQILLYNMKKEKVSHIPLTRQGKTGNPDKKGEAGDKKQGKGKST